jgi:hypothetical protein
MNSANNTLTKEEKRRLKALKRENQSLSVSHESRIHSVNQTVGEIKSPTDTSIEPITVLCVRFGNKYGRDYVERLRNMVAKHITVPYEFVCLTDDKHPISGVRSIVQPSAGYAKLWWHKVHMFDPSLPIKGRILYLDLDLVIHRNINKLVEVKSKELLGIRDFNRKFYPKWQQLNSSALCWWHGDHSYIYENFKKDPKAAMRLHGDQDWIWREGKGRIRFWPDSWIQSYKWEIRDREQLVSRTGVNGFKTVSNLAPPADCCIAVFHGEPKPQDVQDPFVVDNWR